MAWDLVSMATSENRVAMLRTGWWSRLLPSRGTTRKFLVSDAVLLPTPDLVLCQAACIVSILTSSLSRHMLSVWTCISSWRSFNVCIDSAYSMMLLIASKDLNGDRLNGAVVQCVDCSSEGQTFRDSCINLGRQYLARCISGQNLVMLKVKMWEKYRENTLHIFTPEHRITDCIIASLFVIIFISCFKYSLEPW